MLFHLDLSLQQRATLSLAISIWNHQKVKNKISKWSDNIQKFGFYQQGGGRWHKHQKLQIEKISDKWEQLMKAVLEEVNEDLLPPPLRSELFHVVKALGEKIFCWYRYINSIYYKINEEQDDIIDYIGEIYWTPIGNIDEVKILKSYWLKNPNLNVAVVYDIACKNALEDDIDDLWQKVPCSLKNYCTNTFNRQSHCFILECPLYDYLILAYWKYRSLGQLDHFPNSVLAYLQKEYFEVFVYNRNYSLNHNMFILSVCNGYNAAAKYFWEKLTQEERDSSILYSAYLSMFRSSVVCTSGLRMDYIQEKYLEIFIFLINQMTMDQKEAFFRKEPIPDEANYLDIGIENVEEGILSMLSSIWPWQNLFTPVLNSMLQCLEDNPKLVSWILFEISRKMVKPSDAVENSKLQSMLHEAWFIIPGSAKRKMVQNFDKDLCSNGMDHLVRVGDFDSINMIFDDPEIADIRMQTIRFGLTGYKLLIELNEYELLNQFMEKVLRSEEERIYLKSIIDHNDMCEHFVNTERYDSVDNLLNWKFETIEERRQCKDYFKNYEFFMSWVHRRLDSCKESVDKAKKEISIFLEWLFESDDVIACFKREFIVNCEPLNGKLIFFGEFVHTISKKEAKKMRQILA